MYCSEETIAEIKNKVNVLEYIGKKVKLNKNSNLYIGHCPFHHSDANGFVVDIKTKTYCCHECGAGGDIIQFAMDYHKLSFAEAICSLALLCNISIERNAFSKSYFARQKMMVNIHHSAMEFYQEQLWETREVVNYLNNRGISDDTIQKFGLGYADAKKHVYDELKKLGYEDDDIMKSGIVAFPKLDKISGNEDKRMMKNYDKFYNRVIFPIKNDYGVLIGFGGRVVGDKKPKYINSKESILYDKSNNVFGLEFAKDSKSDYFILCEGYMDVIALHQAGFDNAIASLGTALTTSQAIKLHKYKQKIVIAYDSDAAGVNAVKRAIPILERFAFTINVLCMEPFKDPDDFIKSLGSIAFRQRLAAATSGYTWVIKEMLSSDAEINEIANIIEKEYF